MASQLVSWPRLFHWCSRIPTGYLSEMARRWLNHLDPAIKHGKWSQKENLTLMQKQAELGNHWSKIRPFLPGRPDNSIKNQWHW